MDRKAWIIISLCVLGLIAHSYWTAKNAPKRVPSQSSSSQTSTPENNNSENSGKALPASTEGQAPTGAQLAKSRTEEGKQISNQVKLAPEKTTLLSNSANDFEFTNLGGGLKTLGLREHKFSRDDPKPIMWNANANTAIGVLFEASDPESGKIPFEIVEQSEDKIVFVGKSPDGTAELRKTFSINKTEEGDPYLLDLELSFERTGDRPFHSDGVKLYLGACHQLSGLEDKHQNMLMSSNDGDTDKIRPDWFKGSKLLFWTRRNPSSKYEQELLKPDFLALMNQFFVVLVEPLDKLPASSWAKPFPVHIPKEKGESLGLSAAIGLPPFSLNEAKPSQTLRYKFYIGPKEYQRIKSIDPALTEVVDYGIFGFISRALLQLLNFIAKYVKNYGVAIVIATFIIRIFIWPLHQKSMRSMKRMSKLAPQVNALKEKYRDEPQLMNSKMMELYKSYGVNPISGCLPMLLQFPIFLGFYYMLRSAVELRQENFLWVKDLSLPDTVASLSGFDINPLPILMAASMFLQMAMTPKTADNPQQKILMFMPVMFLFFCYNFASALSLYWTTSNVFSIFQTWITNKTPEPELVKKAPKPKLEAPPSPFMMNTKQKPKKKKPRRPRTGG